MSGSALGAPTSPLLAALMARTGGTPTLPANSRYQGLQTRTLNNADGTQTIYLARRLVPAPDRFTAVGTHVMGAGERLDQVAASLLGDPLLAWRLADANRALDPHELEQTGRRIRITLPENLPASASTNA